MTEQEYLMQMIDLLRLEYEKAAKPYIDRLVYLKSFEPLRTIYIPAEAAHGIKE